MYWIPHNLPGKIFTPVNWRFNRRTFSTKRTGFDEHGGLHIRHFWLQNSTVSYRSSLFRVHCLVPTSLTHIGLSSRVLKRLCFQKSLIFLSVLYCIFHVSDIHGSLQWPELWLRPIIRPDIRSYRSSLFIEFTGADFTGSKAFIMSVCIALRN